MSRPYLQRTSTLFERVSDPQLELGQRLDALDRIRERRRHPPSGWHRGFLLEEGADYRVTADQAARLDEIEAELIKALDWHGTARTSVIEYRVEGGRILRSLPW